MKLFVIFAQRGEYYPGEYQPEPVAIVSEHQHDENPDYLLGELEKTRKSDEFITSDVFILTISQRKFEKIDAALNGNVEVTVSKVEKL